MNQNRRQFLKGLGVLGVATLASSAFKLFPAQAEEACDKLAPGASAGIMVKTLHYVPLSTKKGQQCGNCIQYNGDAKNKSGKCNIFQGCEVAKVGWCNSWSKKT